jgi:hypothetical protein
MMCATVIFAFKTVTYFICAACFTVNIFFSFLSAVSVYYIT